MKARAFFLAWVAILSAVAGVVLGIVFSFSLEAVSIRDDVRPGEPDIYGFTVPGDAFGAAVQVTMTWKQRRDSGFLVMACGALPLEYSSVSTEDRLVRLDVGVPTGLDCALAVASGAGKITYTLVVSIAGSGPVPKTAPDSQLEARVREIVEEMSLLVDSVPFQDTVCENGGVSPSVAPVQVTAHPLSVETVNG